MKHFSNKYFILSVFLLLLIFSGTAQSSDQLWSKTSELERSSFKKLERKSIPNDFRVYQLNLNEFKNKLEKVPTRKNKSIKSNTVLTFPNENGVLEKYQIFEAPIMEEALQKKYPTIKSYVGKGIDNPNAKVRLSLTSLGLHAMISQKSGNMLYIDPYTLDKESYIIYKKKSLPATEQFECKVEEFLTTSKIETTGISSKADNANDGILRTFKLAVATTGEYSQFHLDNQGVSATATDAVKKEAVLSAIVVTITRVNEVFERDVAVRMILVANNESIIFLDPLTDNFTNDDGSILIDESQTVIDTNIGTANYDIGHTFSTEGGGLAQLRSPCTSSKARGITGLNSPMGDPYAIDFVAHEMGHQYGASHTFNSDTGSCGSGNRNDATAVEPGSGSTVMAYAGLCAPNNVQNRSDAYFHLVSIQQMWANISAGNSTCADLTTTNNSTPTIEASSNYTIPVSTPFVLNATASDMDGDILTYTWEQLDTEVTLHPLQSTATGGPAFRSLSPTSSSMRYFPEQSTVIAGNLATTWEVLPSVGRTMTFGVTARDNNVNGGQTASEETTITVDGNSGPFNLTSQVGVETWDAGTAQTVTWNVANTNVAPINCSLVNILLSIDGGLTYPIELATNVPNNGVYEIVVPDNATSMARVKVESVGNVFYAINETNITIQTSEFIMNFASYNEAICSPNNVVYTFTYNTFLGFNEETTFSATNNPIGSTVTFNPATATTDNTTVEMTISNIENNNVGNYTVSVIGTSTSITKTTVVGLDVYTTTLNTPNLVSPENDAISILKPYKLNWGSDVNALNYNVQISTNNTFSTIVEEALVDLNYYNPLLLQLNTTYYWRVQSINNCSQSAFSMVYNFTTANEVCNSFSSTDTPLNIPDNNSTGISSVINYGINKIITDVNVTVNVTHPWIGDLTLTLISPSGTSVLLVASRNDDGDNYTNTIFDSEAEVSISSGIAPFTGVFKPQGSLSNFNNEESLGNWTLKVIDEGPDDIGKILNWSLEICGVPSNFTLVSDNFGIEAISETCPDRNNGKLIINSQSNQNYITTINGTAYNFTTDLSVSDLAPGVYEFCITITGETYEQCFTAEIIEGNTVSGKASISSGKASIEIEEGTAPFTIYVNGEEKFETNSPLFNIDVKHGDLLEVKTAVDCEGVYSKTIELLSEIVAYPNPTRGTFDIALPVSQKEVTIELYTIHSQLISVKNYPVVYGKVQLNIENQPTGLYFAKIYLNEPVVIKVLKKY